MTTCWTCSVDAFRRAFRPAARRTTYPKSCGLGRAIPCSIAAEQRHNIIGNRLALVAEESVSGVTAEPPPGQSGTPTHARLYHRQRRNHAVPQGAGDSQWRRDCRCIERGVARGPTQRQTVAGAVERSARRRKAKEGWRPRRADRSAVVGNRNVAGPGAATRPEAPLQAGCGHCHAASARGGNGRRGGERDRLAASYRPRRLLGNLEEKARADPRFGPRGAWPGLSHRRAGEPMKSPSHDEIARLVDRSPQERRRAWRRLHHAGPPLGLSRDLIIRGLADKLQQRAHGGPSRALQRRLRILTGEFEK